MELGGGGGGGAFPKLPTYPQEYFSSPANFFKLFFEKSFISDRKKI